MKKLFIVVKLTECVNKDDLFSYESKNIASFSSSTGAINKLSEIGCNLMKCGHSIENYGDVIVDETECASYSIEHA